jgi:hypothetical protein
MPWLAVGVLISFVAVVLVTVIRYSSRQQEIFRSAWRAFASSRGWRWIAAAGPWYRRTSDAIEGSVEDVPVRVDTYVVSTGKSHVTFTRVRSRLERPFPGKVVASPRSFLTGIAEKLGRRSIPTGNADFDQRIVVRSKARDAALALFDERVRERARELERRACIQVSGDEVKIWWRGAETEPRVLDRACSAAAAIVRAAANA